MSTQAAHRPGASSASALAWMPAWIRAELAPFPGRTRATWRFVLSAALVTVISMALQVPNLPLSLIVVFITARENTVLTRISGIILVIGAVMAVAAGLLLVKFTIDYPLLRILGACAIAFCGMYFMRISKLGPIGFLVAMFVFYFQSFVDLGIGPEALVRTLLWVWVAMTYAIVLTITVNLLFLPSRPARLLIDEMRRQLDHVLDQLEARRTQTPLRPRSMASVAQGVLLLHRHVAFAVEGDKAWRRDRARHLARIAAMDRLATAAAHLSRLPMGALSPAQAAKVGVLHAHCRALRTSLHDGTPFTCAPLAVGTADGPLDSVLSEMGHALQAAGEPEPLPAAPMKREPLVYPDAFSNPAYGRFALKTVLSAMLCYLFYSAVQWPGIHTAMLTCFVIALPSLGAMSHKGLARVVGCALGSVVTLAATVIIIPHLDTITGLLALTLPIIAAGAWVAAGSPRTNYIGLQFVFAFGLSQLGQFGPSIDLTEIRDRMIGILVGVAVSIAVSAAIWPEREGDALKDMLGRLVRSVADLVRAAHDSRDAAARRDAVDKARLRGWSLLTQNREMQARVALEPGWQYAHDSVTPEITTALAQAQEILFAVDWLHLRMQHAGPNLPQPIADSFRAWHEYVAIRLERIAGRLDGQVLPPPAQPPADAFPAVAGASAALREPLADIVQAAHVLEDRIAQLDHRLSPPLI
ncbi:FUSC family protein [Cupriavidus lacunae]|uniref:FUSC family protein n=1 Tax=Cupriavidus lacunae TaxID=2666307 RepID=A0A370P0Z5_9BURK|nr:FUSC family protein [Cupriavidus lacunae]RDK11438.1 FUSC family protein [Cupriavidus lacunae]